MHPRHALLSTTGLLAVLLMVAVCTPHAAETSADTPGPLAEVPWLPAPLRQTQFGLGVTGMIQGTVHNGDNNPDGGNTTDANWSLAAEMTTPLSPNGQAFLLIEASQGNGLTDEIGVGDALFGINAGAGDSEAHLEVTELWYEHRWWQDRVLFTIGKLDLTTYFDTNALANDETTQFLAPGLVNSAVVEFPTDNGLGLRLTVNALPWLDLSVGWGEADADYEDIFADSFGILEAAFKPSPFNRPGVYRFYAWKNWADHTAFDNPTRTHADNWGVGMSLDQQLIDPIAMFFRWGLQDDDVSAVKMSWSTGLEVHGTWWRRPDDVLAVAVGQAMLGSPFKRSAEAPAQTASERFVESYYRFVYNDHLALSLHLQVIDNAGGDASRDTVAVIGGRVHVTF